MRREFAFLLERGFEVVEDGPTRVRFTTPEAAVTVFHGRGSFELDVEFARLAPRYDGEPELRLGDVLAVDPGGELAGFRPPQVSKADAVARAVARLAELTRAHGLPALEQPARFDRMVAESLRRSAALTDDYEARTLREQADAAWHARDLDRVADLYRRLERLGTVELARGEAARLRYAERRRGDARP